MSSVKREIEDESHDQHRPLNKRSKLQDFGMGSFPLSPAQFNPLDEPSPLGLRLRKSPSLLDLIQMRLSEGNSSSKIGAHANTEHKGTTVSAATDKLKASNFPASFLKIGTWEYASKHEGDLVAKCYFAKHKLVWEVLDGGLKNKIEVQWSDIMALKASYPDGGPGNLDVVLIRQPLFFRETNPQPKKHTLWQATSDFTGGQASVHRRHYLQCPPALLVKHFEKLIQSDPRLNFMSQQAEVVLDSPYFETRTSIFDEPNGYNLSCERPATFDLHQTASPLGGQSSSSHNELHDPAGMPAEFLPETLSPSSVMENSAIREIRRAGINRLKDLGQLDHIKVPGLHSAMSMNDLVNHIENRITQHKTSGNRPLSQEDHEGLEILEDISRCLFNDAQYGSSDSDEKSVMSKVNSLCCLLQKDSTTLEDSKGESDNNGHNKTSTAERGIDESNPNPNPLSGPVAEDSSKAPGMSRKDSVGELLLNLPRIASLPKFFLSL